MSPDIERWSWLIGDMVRGEATPAEIDEFQALSVAQRLDGRMRAESLAYWFRWSDHIRERLASEA